MAIFPVNTYRFDPYKSYAFQVFFGTSTTAVAVVSKVSALRRSSDVIEYREGGNKIILKGLGRTKYDPITLERGITQDLDFITWADAAQKLDQGHATASLQNLRREVRLQLMNEDGQAVHGYLIHRCWVSEFQALPDLDAGANTIAVEHIKLENEGWEVDPAIVEDSGDLKLANTRSGSSNGFRAIRLTAPLSRIAVTLREPTGAEDLLLAEGRSDDPGMALRLIERLAKPETDIDWGAQAVFDIDTIILRLRQAALGDRISSHIACSGCGGRVTLSFGIAAYLAHHRPHEGPLTKRGWAASAPDDTGWGRLTPGAPGASAQLRFRLPTLNDQIAAAGAADAPRALARRCIEPYPLPAKLAARVETALAAYAPPLAGPLHGECPDCEAAIEARFEARRYCLQELSHRAQFVYEDVDTLAKHYHWSERANLAMPYARRTEYAERARRQVA